jgi:tetratricopeptide (TPR) repeat protein
MEDSFADRKRAPGSVRGIATFVRKDARRLKRSSTLVLQVRLSSVIALRATALQLVRCSGAALLCALLLAGGMSSESAAASRPASAPADTTDDPRVQTHLLKGVTQAQLGDYEEAILYLETALDWAPDEPILLQALADAHAAKGDYATALFYARQARKHGRARPYYHHRLAELRRDADQPQAALQTYEELVAKYPENKRAYRALADLQATLGRPAAALQTYRTLLEHTARPSVTVYQRMLALYRQTVDSQGIREMLRALVDRRPNRRVYRRQLGEHYAGQGRPEKALDLLAPLAEQRPEDAALQRQVRQLSRETGRATPPRPDTTGEDSMPSTALSVDQLVHRAKSRVNAATASSPPDSTALRTATDLLRRALDRSPPHVAALTLLARIHRAEGDYREAGRVLERALEDHPRDPDRWAQAADAYLDAHRYENAASVAEEGLLLFPGNYALAGAAARARLRSGDHERALDHFQQALDLRTADASSPQETAPLKAGLGLAYTHLDRPEDADATFDAARTAAPNHPTVLRRLAYSLALRDTQLDRALDLARRAVDQSPNNPRSLDTLGWVYFRRGDLTAARRHLQDALGLGPPSARLLEHYGDVQHALGNDATAREYWQKALDRAPERSSLQKKLEDTPTS